jgi:hypothetical protein
LKLHLARKNPTGKEKPNACSDGLQSRDRKGAVYLRSRKTIDEMSGATATVTRNLLLFQYGSLQKRRKDVS